MTFLQVCKISTRKPWRFSKQFAIVSKRVSELLCQILSMPKIFLVAGIWFEKLECLKNLRNFCKKCQPYNYVSKHTLTHENKKKGENYITKGQFAFKLQFW